MACLLWHNREENIQNSRFEQDDDDKAITAQINAWAFNNQSILKERARQAIENLLNQPEQGTHCQVWEDDWMIDECLCAMYDASSESPGK